MPGEGGGEIERSPAPAAWPRSEEPWLARSVRVLGLSILTGLGAALVLSWILGYGHVVGFLSAEMVVVGVALLLLRVTPARWPARLMAVSLPLMATGLVLSSAIGLADVAVLVFPASLVLGGVLLDRWALALLTGLCAACIALVAWNAVGQQPSVVSGVLGLQYAVDAAIILAATAIGLSLVTGQLRRALAELQRREQDLLHTYRALGEHADRLHASEARFRELIDLAADAIIVEDASDRITHVNDRACQMTGRERGELLGWTIGVLFSPIDGTSPAVADPAGPAGVNERLLLRRDGTTVPVETSSRGMPDGSRQTIVRDVSERKRAEAEHAALEERLHQSQKMAAIGRLAGGVAHDFNNLLTAITSSLTMALREVPEKARARRWLKEIDAAAWRAAALTRQLLSFGLRQPYAPKVLDLRDVVRDVQHVVAQLVGTRIALEIRLPESPCPVHVDQVQVERAILNLAANARDAMPEKGTLSIEVDTLGVEEARAARPEAEPRPHVTLTVTDTGSGFDPRLRASLFEPFFTTKASGGGTGLGLAIVHAVVEQNHGWIDASSTPGRGSAFRLHFPLAEEESDAIEASGAVGAGPGARPD